MAENPGLYGEWTLYKGENMEEVMTKAGAPKEMAMKMANANPTVVIAKGDGNRIRITQQSGSFKHEQELTLGTISRLSAPIGQEEKDTLAEWQEGGRLVVLAGKPGTDVRKEGMKQTRELLDNGEMKLTMEFGGSVGYCWFKKN